MFWICHRATFLLSMGAILLGFDQAGCAGPRAGPEGEFRLTSAAFQADATIPKKHTCEGQDISPPLNWTDPPAGTETFALIADDPDAPGGMWVHWVLYDLPPDARSLPEDLPKTNDLPNGARQGRNDFPRIGYGGPCPPPGPAHRYFFKLYALDGRLGLKRGATKADVEEAMKGHVLSEAHWAGRFKR